MSDTRAHPQDANQELLTLMEAAALLRIGRTTAYELAHEFIRTNGESGLPVVRIGKQLRVQRTRLNEVIRNGTQPQPPSSHVPTPLKSRKTTGRLTNAPQLFT